MIVSKHQFTALDLLLVKMVRRRKQWNLTVVKLVIVGGSEFGERCVPFVPSVEKVIFILQPLPKYVPLALFLQVDIWVLVGRIHKIAATLRHARARFFS